MPYPMLTLPYPFTRRLHQLLTPDELQSLQTAAGNNIRDLKPLITTATFNIFAIIWHDSRIKYMRGHEFIESTGDLLKVTTGVWFSFLSKFNFNYLPFKRIETPYLNFNDCHISNELLQRASKTIETKMVIFSCKKYIEEDVTFLTVATTFPNANLISFDSFSMWRDEDVKTIQRSQDYLIIHHCEFNELFFCVKPEELFNFIKNQPPAFCLHILYYPYTDDELRNDYIRKLTPLVKDRFDKVTYGHPKIRITFPIEKMCQRFDVTYYFKEE